MLPFLVVLQITSPSSVSVSYNSYGITASVLHINITSVTITHSLPHHHHLLPPNHYGSPTTTPFHNQTTFLVNHHCNHTQLPIPQVLSSANNYQSTAIQPDILHPITKLRACYNFRERGKKRPLWKRYLGEVTDSLIWRSFIFRHPTSP